MEDLSGDEASALKINDRVDDIAGSRPCANGDDRADRNSWVSGACIGVLMMPGDPAFTRTPVLANSIASSFVTALRPPLVSEARAVGTLDTGWFTRLAGQC